MILPCTDCIYRKVRVEGHREFIGCSDNEKKKGFHYDDFFYHHTCDNHKKEEMTMTNEERVSEVMERLRTFFPMIKTQFGDSVENWMPFYEKGLLNMAEWKDKQLRERLDFEIEKANAYYDKQLNRHEMYKHIGAVIALSELLGIKFPTDRLHMRFATMD